MTLEDYSEKTAGKQHALNVNRLAGKKMDWKLRGYEGLREITISSHNECL